MPRMDDFGFGGSVWKNFPADSLGSGRMCPPVCRGNVASGGACGANTRRREPLRTRKRSSALPGRRFPKLFLAGTISGHSGCTFPTPLRLPYSMSFRESLSEAPPAAAPKIIWMISVRTTPAIARKTASAAAVIRAVAFRSYFAVASRIPWAVTPGSGPRTAGEGWAWPRVGCRRRPTVLRQRHGLRRRSFRRAGRSRIPP